MVTENFDAQSGSVSLTAASPFSKGNFSGNVGIATVASNGIAMSVDASAGRGGTPALKVVQGAGVGAAQTVFGATTGIVMDGSQNVSMRAYFKGSGNPGIGTYVGLTPELVGPGFVGYNYGWYLKMDGSGYYTLYEDGTYNTVSFNVADGNWFRFECQATSASAFTARVFYGANLETTTPSLTFGPYSPNGVSPYLLLGYATDNSFGADGGNLGSAYMVVDDIDYRNTLEWIGPAGGSPATTRQGWGITRA